MNNNKFIADISAAVEILQQGGLVAMPTETVYGLGADATNEAAIHRIFAAKERPYNHPLIVHIASVEQLTDWASDIPADAYKLAEAYWPGPLTLILKKQNHVLDVVTGAQDTVGLRIPCHPVAQALLNAFKGGIAAPSANKFTHISPTTASAVYEELGDRVDLILEGGDCEVGLESTILDLTGDVPVILRPGMITAAQVSAVLNKPVHEKQTVTTTRVPGMHHLHYAPVTETVLMNAAEISAYFIARENDTHNIAVVMYSQLDMTLKQRLTLKQMSSDPAQYAHDIYHVLRTLDNQHLEQIIIESVPETPQWDAIRDRLMKAAARKSA